MSVSLGNVVVFCKERPHVAAAIDFVKAHAESVTVFKGHAGEDFPEQARDLTPDILISYISSWIIPERLLRNTRKWAINFHPGPPEYPGTGCTNFALYNEEASYGVTAHSMEATVDTGHIIGVKRFNISPSDSAQSVTLKSYDALIELFQEVITSITESASLPKSNETWKTKPTTRKQLNALCRIDPSMQEDEVRRRIRATYFPGKPGPYIELAGYKFNYQEEK